MCRRSKLSGIGFGTDVFLANEAKLKCARALKILTAQSIGGLYGLDSPTYRPIWCQINDHRRRQGLEEYKRFRQVAHRAQPNKHVHQGECLQLPLFPLGM